MNKEIVFLFLLKTVVANATPFSLQPVHAQILQKLCSCCQSCHFLVAFRLLLQCRLQSGLWSCGTTISL